MFGDEFNDAWHWLYSISKNSSKKFGAAKLMLRELENDRKKLDEKITQLRWDIDLIRRVRSITRDISPEIDNPAHDAYFEMEDDDDQEDDC